MSTLAMPAPLPQTVYVSTEAHACPRCDVMRFIFVNTAGRTVCWSCAMGEEDHVDR